VTRHGFGEEWPLDIPARSDHPISSAPMERPASAPPARGRGSDDGAVSFFMIVIFGMFLLFAGAIHDAGRVLNANAHASDVAAKAARFGAQELDLASIRSGTYHLRPDAAQAAATAYLNRRNVYGEVIATETEVTVTVTWPVEFRFLSKLRPEATVTQTRTAAPTTG
jgi:Flp pilus assembly protein TadG